MTCPICEKPLQCVDAHDSRHQAAAGSAVKDCPIVKGSIWVQVLDDKGAGVGTVNVTLPGKSAPSDDSGFAFSDPLAEGSYDVEVSGSLPDSHKNDYLLPDTKKVKAKVVAGEITFLKFRLARINVVTPKIEAEYKVVLLDRGLAAHQSGEPEADKIHADATRIEVSVTESNRAEYPFKTTAKLKFVPDRVDVFLDEDCKTRLAADLTADQIANGKTLSLWLRGKQAGKFEVTLEFADPADVHIRPASPTPKLELGVIELLLQVHQHDLAAVKAVTVNPDTDPISDYHTALKNKDLPAQVALTDEQKVKQGRLLHEQIDSSHGCAKLLVKLLTKDLPAGAEDYEVYLNRTNKSGAVEVVTKEFDGTVETLPAGPYKLAALSAKDQELWIQGKSACTEYRGVRLDLTLDRAEGGLAKEAKRNADWARFTVVKIKEVKLDYVPQPGKENAWDKDENRFFINLKADPDGRKITIGAQLSAEIKDVVVHFMLVEHEHNRMQQNWGVDLPDGTRRLNPVAVVNNSRVRQVFGTNEPKWTWKDIDASVKHLDKEDRQKIVHVSAKTDAKGYAKKEVTLSRFGGDKFYLAAYVEQDPHLGKYIDGHADLKKRKPVMREKPIQVWRKFWYKEVKIAGLDVNGFEDAAETYKDVKAVMEAGTVVQIPRATANAFVPRVIYPKHMVSYYLSGGRYQNNYPGDTSDALVVGDDNEKQFFSRATAEADKPVMYPMLNAHALWIGGNNTDCPVSVGPGSHPWATPDEFQNSQVVISFNEKFLDPPLQGGTLLVRGKWAAQEWIPHPNPSTPSDPDQPPGAPPGRWGNGRQGDLVATDVSLDPNRSDPHEVRITLPAAVGAATGNRVRIKIFGLHVQCGTYFLGTSYDDGIVNAFTPNDVQDFVNTINHESGHSFAQVTTRRPTGVPPHPLQYQNQGSHCAYDNKSCVMYASGPQPGSLNRYCPVCQPYLLVADLSDVKGKLV